MTLVKKLSKIVFYLFVLLLIAFAAHSFAQQKNNTGRFANHLILSYSLQMMLAILSYGILMLLHKKHKDKLGFIFITSSILKFIVAYAILRPVFYSDGQISKPELLSLLIPYLLALSYNTWSIQSLIKEN